MSPVLPVSRPSNLIIPFCEDSEGVAIRPWRTRDPSRPEAREHSRESELHGQDLVNHPHLYPFSLPNAVARTPL